MHRVFRSMVALGCLVAFCSPMLSTIGSSPASGTTVTVTRRVPFRGTFLVTATWGMPDAPNHATPAIDFKMPIGTPVYATARGWVDFTSVDSRNCNPKYHIPAGGTYADAIQWCIDHGLTGTRIRIRHDDGTFSMYVHLSKIHSGISAAPSTHVVAGQLIAWSGNSGISTGPHLHYSKINAAGTTTVDPGALVACWGTTRHTYIHLSTLLGKYVRNDNFACR